MRFTSTCNSSSSFSAILPRCTAKFPKNALFIVAWLLQFPGLHPAYSQIDTTLRDYFPLHVGDLWEYERDEYPTYPRYQVRNVGDTLMPNGRIYFHFDGPSPGGFYRMDDSLRVYKYQDFPYYPECQDSEFVVYDLRVCDRGVWSTYLPSFIGDSLTNYIGLELTLQMFPVPRLGVFADTKMFCEAQIDTITGDTIFCPLVPRIGYAPRRLAKGFGFIWEQFEGPATNLVGAIINGVQYGTIVAVSDIPSTQPNEFVLNQNYPNPFNPSTTIQYQIPERTYISLKVYNVLGQEVAHLVDKYQDPGNYQTVFEGSKLPSGMYIYVLRAGRFLASRRMRLIK